MPRKIGVLTFHRCINYGSYWQARCLAEGLAHRGQVALLDHRSSAAASAERRCALDPSGTLPPRSERRAYLAKLRKFMSELSRLPLSPPFCLEAPAQIEPVELAIVGSDEVWNFRHPWYAAKPLFFGEGLKADRIVAYAASFGGYGAAEGLEPCWADRLRSFDALAVRDHNSQRLIGAAVGKPAVLVLDPCLQFHTVCRRAAAGEPMAIVYGHSFPAWFAAAARRWADARGVRLLSLGYANPWAHQQWISAGPSEFADAMGAAIAVVTNFFHGCVFSLLNGKPFACAATPYRATKVTALAGALSAERHVIAETTPAAAFEAALDQPLAPRIGARIEQLRLQSAAFLDHALA